MNSHQTSKRAEASLKLEIREDPVDLKEAPVGQMNVSNDAPMRAADHAMAKEA